MTGQMFKDITYHEIEQLSLKILKRELTPLEYNMFLHHHVDNLERIYYNAKQKIDHIIMEYLSTLKEKHENTSV